MVMGLYQGVEGFLDLLIAGFEARNFGFGLLLELLDFGILLEGRD